MQILSRSKFLKSRKLHCKSTKLVQTTIQTPSFDKQTNFQICWLWRSHPWRTWLRWCACRQLLLSRSYSADEPRSECPNNLQRGITSEDNKSNHNKLTKTLNTVFLNPLNAKAACRIGVHSLIPRETRFIGLSSNLHNKFPTSEFE